MSTYQLPLAGDAYDRTNEQRTRSNIDLRLTDIEAKLSALQTIYGTLSLGEETITLANGANNNVAPGYATYVRLSGPSAAFSTTGFSGGSRGRLMIVRNTVAQDWTISHESGSSDAANRIITNAGADVALSGVSAAVFLYDATSERWILIAVMDENIINP